jgi:hypothetical protein
VHAPGRVRLLRPLGRSPPRRKRDREARRPRRVRCGAAGRRSRCERPCTASRLPRRAPADTSRRSARRRQRPPGPHPPHCRGRPGAAGRDRRPVARSARRASRTPPGRVRPRARATPHRRGRAQAPKARDPQEQRAGEARQGQSPRQDRSYASCPVSDCSTVPGAAQLPPSSGPQRTAALPRAS